MFDFLKNRREKDGDGLIALDIGTKAVKALFFTIQEKQNQKGEVTGHRAVIRSLEMVEQKRRDNPEGMITDIANVIENCKEAIKLASKKAGRRPSRLVLGVSGESIKGVTSVETCERESPGDKINLAEFGNIIHKLQWQAFAETRKKISEEMGYPEIDMKLVNAAIVDMRIDGYRVTNPLGFQGKEIKMDIFNSFAPLHYLDALKSIADHLELELLGIVSASYALSRSADTGNRQASTILMDIGESSTDIALVTDGIFRGSRMFGMGGRTLTKRIAIELNISLEEAEKLKLTYASDKLEPKSKKIIADIIDGDIEVWLEGVVLALSEFRQVGELPSKILLSGGSSLLPEFKDSLNNRKWHKKLPFSQPPQASLMKVSDWPEVVDEAKIIKDPQSVTVAALANLGLELAGEETLVQKSLRKVIGIMKV